MTKYDAIVVGARCAGSSVARLLARSGFRVLLIDRAELPSDTLSTHLMKPRGMAYLQRWGVLPELWRRGTPSLAGLRLTREGRSLNANVPAETLRNTLLRDHGWDTTEAGAPIDVAWAVPRRIVLDQVLFESATQAGAEVMLGLSLKELLRDANGRVCGIRAEGKNGRKLEAHASVVIGADGRHSKVAELASAGFVGDRPLCGFAYYAYFTGPASKRPLAQVNLRGRSGLALASTNGDAAMISVFGPKAWFQSFKENIEENFWKVISHCAPADYDSLRALTQVERFYGTASQENFLRTGTGPGWALLGDAYMSIDQCTATGMTFAFRDAELCAAALRPALGGECPMDVALAAFEERRLALTQSYFQFAADMAEYRAPSADSLRVWAALLSQERKAQEYLCVSAAILPVAHFFNPDNLSQLIRSLAPDEMSSPAWAPPSPDAPPWAS